MIIVVGIPVLESEIGRKGGKGGGGQDRAGHLRQQEAENICTGISKYYRNCVSFPFFSTQCREKPLLKKV